MKQHPAYLDIWVTEDGRVFRELTPSVDSAGYAQIRNGIIRERRHTLVCETYHGPRPPGHVVRHLDGSTDNDHKDNLAWGTQADNAADAVAHGTIAKGSKHFHAKLTEDKVREIRKRIAGGEKSRRLAEEFGVTEAAICDLRKGRTWAWLK